MSKKRNTTAKTVLTEKNTSVGPMVYCGPSVKGAVRQYTVFAESLPDTLREFLQENPEAAALLVTVDKFPQIRKKLETPGSAEATLYQLIKSKL